MRTPARLGLYGAALTAVFGVAFGAGALAGPVAAPDPTETAHGHVATGRAGGHGDAGRQDVPGGLMVSQHGYSMQRLGADPVAGRPGEFAFRVVGPDGEPVRRYEVENDRRMHLIVVRRDLTGYQHVHPELGPDGTWRLSLTFATPGTYRAFADFTPTGGQATTLGVDVPVAGDVRPAPLPPPGDVSTVDGYTVTLAGRAVLGTASALTFRVERDGRPVTDLQPYLGAFGHLVALRAGDLAYLHVHPEQGGDAGEVAFRAEVPSGGRYRLFLDFRHAGTVHTAEFTLDV